MQQTNRTSQIFRWIVFLVLVGLGLLSIFLLREKRSFVQEDWLGNWEIEYFFEHAPQLRYSGTLQLGWTDSLSGFIEVYPPKSTRPEKLSFENLVVSEDFRLLSGQIVHKSYKISGGHLKESFVFSLQKGKVFAGEGECLAYCAEGTIGIPIIWSGSKLDLQ